MSVGSTRSLDDVAAACRKLEPPRSLHGFEDAEVIWDTIARRFPNAAPLLCEMETVIERAEDLLQQLKSPQCVQGIDTSGSFHTPDSRESNATISMVSDIESFVEETNPEVAETAGTQLEARDVHGRQADLEPQHRSEQSIRCEVEYPSKGYHLNSPARLDEVVQHLETSSTNKRDNSQGESEADVTDSGDKGIDVSSEERVKLIMERSSLEGWAKVADNALREWRNANNVDTSDGNVSLETRPSVDENRGSCPIEDDCRLCDETAQKLNESGDTNVKDYLQNSAAKSSSLVANYRSPLAILEEYATRCSVTTKYKCKPKPNLYVIHGDLCGFRAMSCAATQDLAKNELAAKILWMVAERQMDGLKLSPSICGLSDLSRAEMLEVMAFHGGELRNASQTIYKLCLVKGEPVPEYTLHKMRTNQGFVYEAQCTALRCTGIGQGSRKDGARIAAAENLCEKYRQEAEQQMTQD